jgi:rhombotail lipoprotein
VLEYLYPEGKEASPAEDVSLELPLAIGLAFVPESKSMGDSALPPAQQEALLKRVKDAFVGVQEIERIEVIPSSFVSAGGGFENVDQIRRALGIDLIVLVSFDQTQFDDPNLASFTYWTIIGAYVIPGTENETHTFVNASAFDIDSRALLLHAPGQSVVTGTTTPIDVERSLREDRIEGFELAVDDLITNLGGALGQFREQVRAGTVRGQGTPAVSVSSAGGAEGGGTGVGGAGLLEVALGLLLLAAARRADARA